ncbi:MAG: biotin/lipoyl-binding protein [Candidatus Saccharibacteria bacterium]
MKFLMGLVFVLLLVGGLLLYLNNTMSTVHSYKAELRADAVTVGTDYPGLVVKQPVEEGDRVSKGQVLFEIRSPQLTASLADHTTTAAALPFTLDKTTGDIVFKASDDGVIQKINYRAGSYAPVGGVLATINTVGSLYVAGHYRLTPPDYARIAKGNALAVTFPDNSKVLAQVYNISVASNGNSVDTIIKGRLAHADINEFRFSVGTPVEASLKLTNKTWYQGLLDLGRQLLKPKAT